MKKILGFWENIKKPIMALAPMADITDSPFRQIVAKIGKPDVFFTGFISADGLCSADQNKFGPQLSFTKIEKPIACQLFGAKPENFFKSAKLINKLGFDGIDLNMGCPYRKIEKQGAGASLMLNPSLAKEIILACRQGAPDLPISVKTRLGYEAKNLSQWIKSLLEAEPTVITIHGRTRNEKSKAPADWEEISQAAKNIKKNSKNILIIGNGDIKDLTEAQEKAEKYQVDGIMVGRAVMANPWFFSGRNNITIKEKLLTLKEHARLIEKTFGSANNFLALRKFFSCYVNNFFGAKTLRIKLMSATKRCQLNESIDYFLSRQKIFLIR